MRLARPGYLQRLSRGFSLCHRSTARFEPDDEKRSRWIARTGDYSSWRALELECLVANSPFSCVVVNSLREQKMFISNEQNEPHVANCDRTTQTLKEPGPCGNQLTQLAEHGPEAADQNPIEGLHKLQPQQAVRFRKESAVQLAPSECEEPRLPDTKHIRNSHDA